MDARSTTSSDAPMRRATKPRIGLARQPRLLEAQETVAVELQALHLAARAREQLVVPDVEQRRVGGQELLDLRVDLLALVLVESGARLVEQLVHLRAGVPAVVERALRVDELVDVAVRVHAPAPADQARVERPRVLLVELGGELGRLQLDVESGLLDHRL